MLTKNVYPGSPGASDPAEQALIEEFSSYLAVVTKAVAGPIIAAMSDQEQQIRECSRKLDEERTRQVTRILRKLEEHGDSQSALLSGRLAKLEEQNKKQADLILRRLDEHNARQSTVIWCWMTAVFVMMLLQCGLILKLVMRK